MYNKFSEANYGSKDASNGPEVGTYIMFLNKFVRPNKNISVYMLVVLLY